MPLTPITGASPQCSGFRISAITVLIAFILVLVFLSADSIKDDAIELFGRVTPREPGHFRISRTLGISNIRR